MELVEDITLNMDDNMKTAGVFIDLKKAFDTIDHTILIFEALHYIGWRIICLREINMFNSMMPNQI